MLPFLAKDKEASVSVAPDKILRKPDQEEDYDTMHAAAEDILSAIQAKDVKGLADALRAAFDLMESEPHEEGE